MNVEGNPYETPSPAGSPAASPERFSGWSTALLVLLFFIPVGFGALAWWVDTQWAHYQLTELLIRFALGSTIAVSLLSAWIHTVRTQSGLGTLFLFSFVYLLAEILSLLTLRFGIGIYQSL